MLKERVSTRRLSRPKPPSVGQDGARISATLKVRRGKWAASSFGPALFDMVGDNVQ